MLRNVEKVGHGRRACCGQKLRLPVILAPIGSLQDMVASGGAAPTQAAARFGALHMLSSANARRAWRRWRPATITPRSSSSTCAATHAWVDDYIERAIANALHRALPHRRPRLLRPARARPRQALRRRPPRRGAADRQLPGGASPGPTSTRLQNKFKIPFILKGIATAEDARIAIEHGVEGIYVSNHGGRQLDHGMGAIAVLPEVVEAVGGRAEIIVDGGFLRGTDIVKAMALGADAVGIGRLQGLALPPAARMALVACAASCSRTRRGAAARPPGRHTYAELDNELHRARQHRSRAAGWTSAFPLLKRYI